MLLPFLSLQPERFLLLASPFLSLFLVKEEGRLIYVDELAFH